tara:strand:- start:2015 stop:2956 length:942 start_codon:yes stop_codon:yes gene_type:complete
MEYSPIAFFAYKRPFHTFEVLNSLALNEESKKTDLYAFIDGHKKNSEIHLIDNVERIIKSFHKEFKSITINRSEINLSGGTNQRRGITSVLSKYDSVISLEDDIYVSKYFLFYMNNALKIYKDEKKVWHINAFNYPVNINKQDESFFMRSMQCWGWGTWKDKWFQFMNDPLSNDPYFLKSKFDLKMRKEFDLNLSKSIFWSQVEDNADGKLNNTWDIFWYSYIFLNKGLCLTPNLSLTRNIGHDGSGIHSNFDKEILLSKINDKKLTNFPVIIEEDIYCLDIIRDYLNSKNKISKRITRKFFQFIYSLKKRIS